MDRRGRREEERKDFRDLWGGNPEQMGRINQLDRHQPLFTGSMTSSGKNMERKKLEKDVTGGTRMQMREMDGSVRQGQGERAEGFHELGDVSKVKVREMLKLHPDNDFMQGPRYRTERIMQGWCDYVV